MLGLLADNLNVCALASVVRMRRVPGVFDHEGGPAGSPLSDLLGVLPELVLLPFGDPALD